MAQGQTSRADIARTTGLTAATVSDLIGELLDEGLVSEVGFGPSAGGKPPTLLDIDASARSVIAVDLSDGARVGSVLDLRGTSSHRTARFESAPSGRRGVDELIDTIDELMSAAPAPPLGIGIGTPGVVAKDGTVVEASNLDWHQLPLARLTADRFELPVHVINNSRAAALAEYSYGDHGAENLLVIKFGRGIGAGIVIDGRIHGGEDSAAGEIGHVVVDPAGPACHCGRRGCLEKVAGVPYLVEALAPIVAAGGADRLEILARAGRRAAEGDEDVLAVIGEAGTNVAKVLSATVAILDIHRVVVTGQVAALGDSFLACIRREVESAILPALAEKLDLCYGRTGDRAVRLGAAALVIKQELGVV
jgi:predicted NBD/HSP70 family sugar kinase